MLAVTNMYPTPVAPHAGRFIQQQIEALRRIGLDVEVLFVNRMERGICGYAGLPIMLRKTVDLFKPELIHVMYGGIMSWLVRQVVQDRPVIVTFHGSDLLGQPYDERPVRRFLGACGVMASRKSARQCDGIVAVAEHLLKRLPESIPSSKIQIIPCGVDLDLFKPIDQVLCRERLGWTQDTFHILFQNTGDPVKRPKLAYGAVEHLQYLGVRAELHELCGVQYEQVPVWLNASDVLLLTSHHEGSPTIVKEALACNLPIVSVRVGDVPQRIQEIEGCHLSAPEPIELAQKLFLVQKNPKSINARDKIHSLSVDFCAHKLSRFYTQVLTAC